MVVGSWVAEGVELFIPSAATVESTANLRFSLATLLVDMVEGEGYRRRIFRGGYSFVKLSGRAVRWFRFPVLCRDQGMIQV